MLKQIITHISKILMISKTENYSPVFLEILELLKNKEDWCRVEDSTTNVVQHKTKDLTWACGFNVAFRDSARNLIYSLSTEEMEFLRPIAREYYLHFNKSAFPTNIIKDREHTL